MAVTQTRFLDSSRHKNHRFTRIKGIRLSTLLNGTVIKTVIFGESRCVPVPAVQEDGETERQQHDAAQTPDHPVDHRGCGGEETTNGNLLAAK